MEERGVPHDLKMAPDPGDPDHRPRRRGVRRPTQWLNTYWGEDGIGVMIDLILDVVSLVGMLVATVMVCRIQANFNRYWAAVVDAGWPTAPGWAGSDGAGGPG